MTKLGRPVRREVESRTYGPLIIALTAEGLYLREKGRRTSYLMPYGLAYQISVEAEVRARKRQRRRTK